MKLGEIIKEYRVSHRISQRRFAEMSGLSNAYISILEKDYNPTTKKPVVPTIEACLKCAAAMGMTLEDLINEMSGDVPTIDVSVKNNSPDTQEIAKMLSQEFKKDVLESMTPFDNRLVYMYHEADDKIKKAVNALLDLE